MTVVLVLAMMLVSGEVSVASPAQPVSEPALILKVDTTDLVEVPSPVEGERGGTVLHAEGRPLAHRGARYPVTARFATERRSVRLRAGEAERVSPSDILVLAHVGHSVYDHQPTHLIADVITPADLADDGLMRVATANPDVPVLHLKEIEGLLRDEKAPYMERGFDTLLEWDLHVAVSARGSGPFSEASRYGVTFYSPTGRVNAEWTLVVDIERRTVDEGAMFEEAPEADPGA